MRVEVLQPHGECAGVCHALAMAYSELEAATALPLYCLHELVHNELVIAALNARGMKVVDSLAEVPEGARILFSAHGVAPEIYLQAAARNLLVVDATCPFVRKVHLSARNFAVRGAHVLVIGYAKHVECRGIIGEVNAIGGKWTIISPEISAEELNALTTKLKSLKVLEFGVVAQTTVDSAKVGELIAKLTASLTVVAAAEVCQATNERQRAVREFTGDALLVLGSETSSNTRRLLEAAKCSRVFRAGTFDEVKALDLRGIEVLGLTAGASTPEQFFKEVEVWLRQLAN